MDGTIGFPDAEQLPGDHTDMPYFIVADDTFALRTWQMKPFYSRTCYRADHQGQPQAGARCVEAKSSSA